MHQSDADDDHVCLSHVSLHRTTPPSSPPSSNGGPNVVLFLHGFPEIWYTWRYQMIALANAGFRAIAPDYRGYGLSDVPPELSTQLLGNPSYWSYC
ncbi:Bifunctional epoxide hydrolase 2 [Morella rubra]|uniref:Bifunctional epoxide hydrolase 2 n=1 Tax=Morella rubra TaxID=262757 RepID=A0A6A1WQ84_9ROSI|nr:Bifunctional epoxide hydrolase 2 [Morella rubra]